ncbi:hypothetical protein OTU49_001373, partial [Cherax quadricarinatus]
GAVCTSWVDLFNTTLFPSLLTIPVVTRSVSLAVSAIPPCVSISLAASFYLLIFIQYFQSTGEVSALGLVSPSHSSSILVDLHQFLLHSLSYSLLLPYSFFLIIFALTGPPPLFSCFTLLHLVSLFSNLLHTFLPS